MPAILGMRGTGSFDTDRPRNIRQGIVVLEINGEAPLTAMLQMLKEEATDDPEFKWGEKRPPLQRMQVNGIQLAADGTIEVLANAKDAVKGTIVMNERTGEKVYVNADPTLDTALAVTRGFGTTAAVDMADADFLTIIGSAHEEGATPPTGRHYAPTKFFNYTQIFRTATSLTRTAKGTRLEWDKEGPTREDKRETLSLHAKEMEKAFIFGERFQGTGAGGHPIRTTQGIVKFIATNLIAHGGPIDETTLDTYFEQIFRYGSTEKLALVGSTFARVLNTLAKRNGNTDLVKNNEAYGMKLVRYITAFGTLYWKMHPLFNWHPEWRKNALIVDTKQLAFRYMANGQTKWIGNRQNPGEDRYVGEYLTEAGLELGLEETHAYLTGIDDAIVG